MQLPCDDNDIEEVPIEEDFFDENSVTKAEEEIKLLMGVSNQPKDYVDVDDELSY